MFSYYLTLALRSFRRNKVITALMILLIGLGIGATMTSLTVFHVLSGDPLPGRSHTLFYVQLDPSSLVEESIPGAEPEDQMTRFDAEALLRERRGDRQALMSAGSVAIEQQRDGLDPFILTDARYTSSDFFAMFDTPFLYGNGWGRAEDDRRSPVAVIAKPLNDQLFGGGNSIGKSLRLSRGVFRIVGVLDDWRPTLKFYDLMSENYAKHEQVFVPFSTSRELTMGNNSSLFCWNTGAAQAQDPEGDYGMNAPCTWLQYWVQLDTPAKVDAYRGYLVNYSEQQRAAGRFERPTNVRLRSLMEWLDYKQVVPGDVHLQVWQSFGILLVCVLNMTGLLLVKFLRRSGEIGIRRALGASRRAIFAQLLIEAGVVGLAGGALGLVFALVGLWAVRQRSVGYAELAHLDLPMLVITFVLAVAASVLAGLLPAWRACRIAPALQIKAR